MCILEKTTNEKKSLRDLILGLFADSDSYTCTHT